MPNNKGWTWKKWFTCAMCGFDYPIDKMAIQDGQKRCTVLPCVDKDEGTDGTHDGKIRIGETRDGNIVNNG